VKLPKREKASSLLRLSKKEKRERGERGKEIAEGTADKRVYNERVEDRGKRPLIGNSSKPNL